MTGQSKKANIGGSFNPAAGTGQVIPYSQADDSLRRRMDRAMKEISRAPDSFEAVISYGHKPLDKLSRTLNGIVKLQGAFNSQIPKIAGAVQVLQADTKSAEQVAQALRELHETLDVTAPMMKEAGALGRASRQVTRGIDLHLGAGEKVSSLYAEKFIKEADAEAQRTRSPEALACLQDIKRRAEDFEDRRYILGTSRAGALETKQQLKIMTGMMNIHRRKIAGLIKSVDRAREQEKLHFEQAIHDATILARSIVLPKPFQFKKQPGPAFNT